MTQIDGTTAAATDFTDADAGDDSVTDLIARVGGRVRRARESKGIPRRVLSEMSGVSPRYLAQLEAGEGNISIGLLQRVASALSYRIDWLIGEEDPWASEALRVAELYRSAGPEARRIAMDALSPETMVKARAQRVCLIGLRGAGKSTLGALAGASLNVPFIELNREIEEQSGMPVGEVMALYGQEGYRKLEAKAVSHVISDHNRVVLAVGGGIVAEPDTYNNLLAHFHTIWIKTSPDEHMSRVRAQGDERPMAGNPEAMEELKSILKTREALYERALEQIDTSGKSVDLSIRDLLKLIEARKFID